MLLNKFTAIFNPERFQGWGKKNNYFEGWYFKVVNASESKAFAFIPGVAMDEKNNRQSFIQVLDGKLQKSEYHKFSFDSFIPSANKFQVSIQENHFSEKSISLNLPDVIGTLNFSGNVHWPKHWYSPGIMGPFAFAPFMECYHGIVSLDHAIQGKLLINGDSIDFDNGRGYIEKDWGRSFPSAYLWLQSNHFDEQGISLKASVANIPWIRNSFVGFIAGIWIQDRLIKFTTYNRSSLRKLSIQPKNIELVIENNNHRLEINAQRNATSVLASPIRGAMEGKIEESMSSKVDVTVFDKKNKTAIFRGLGRNAGLEIAGNTSEIITG
jgi:hypothetical protein